MPGRASRSAWVAVLRSTSAGLAAGAAVFGAGLVVSGLVGVWACPRAGTNSSEAASVTQRRICLNMGCSCEVAGSLLECLDGVDDRCGVALDADLGPVLLDL